MKKLDYYHDTLIALSNEIEKLQYNDLISAAETRVDIRKVFHQLILACLKVFYYHQILLSVRKEIYNDKSIRDSFRAKIKEKHFYSETHEKLDDGIPLSLIYDANRGVVLSSWTAFETTLTFLCMEVLSKEKMKNSMNIDILNY